MPSRSEGVALTGYWIPAHVGEGVGLAGIVPPPPPSPPSPPPPPGLGLGLGLENT